MLFNYPLPSPFWALVYLDVHTNVIIANKFVQVEQRERMEKENQQTLADEIDRIKIETEQEKNELKVFIACNVK